MAENRLLKALTPALIILGFAVAPVGFAANHSPNVSSRSNTPTWNQKHSGNSKSRQAQNPPMKHNHGSSSN